jgi:hypothetical protein
VPVTSSTNYTTTPAYPMNPNNPAGLTLQDYADILQADPFVAVNGNSANVCHPTYGPDIDPNDPETISAPPATGPVASVLLTTKGAGYTGTATVTFSAPTSGTTATGTANMTANGSTYTVASVTITNPGSGYTTPPTVTFSGGGGTTQATAVAYLPRTPISCGTPGSVMSRFQPYGTVEYPVPGPNGLPSTYSGTFQYSNTDTDTSTTTDSHTTGTSTDTTYGFNQSLGLGIGPVSISLASFNASYTSGSSMTLQNSSTNETSNSAAYTSTAGYSITGPQLSDNYTGPSTYSIYLDNVYRTYAFYSPLEPQPVLSTIFVSLGSTAATSSAPGIYLPSSTIVTTSPSAPSLSAPQEITLTNASPLYALTLAGPAVTFSDPGFILIENNSSYQDTCSNQQLLPNGQSSGGQTYSCTAWIQFAPQYSDAPNPVTLMNSPAVQASLIAAGTENVDPFQNILVTSQVPISAVATSVTQGATLLPTGVSQSTLKAVNPLPYIYTYPSPTTEVFALKNNYNTSVTPTQINLSDKTDFTLVTGSSDTCLNTPLSAGATCNFTVTFNGTGIGPVDTAISVMGTVPAWESTVPAFYSTPTIQLAIAGAVGVNPGIVNFSEAPSIFGGIFSAGPDCGIQFGNAPCGWVGGNAPSGTLTILNTTSYPATISYTSTGIFNIFGGTCNGSPITVAPNGGTCGLVLNVSNPSCTITSGDSCLATYSGSVSATATLQNPGLTTNTSTILLSAQLTYVVFTTNNNAVPITIHGVEKSVPVAVPATAATASLTVKSLGRTVQRESLGAEPSKGFTSIPTGKESVEVKVGSYRTTVTFPAGSFASTVAWKIATALNVSGSPVKASSKGAVVSITSIATGSKANLAFSVTGNAAFKILPSGSTLTGGADATTITKYDAGIVSLTLNGMTAPASWEKGSTATTIASALAASVNKVATPYWSATSSGDVVTLTSGSSSTEARSKSPAVHAIDSSSQSASASTASGSVGVTITDTAGFTPASFGAAKN